MLVGNEDKHRALVGHSAGRSVHLTPPPDSPAGAL
jgi:hypothetical protein